MLCANQKREGDLVKMFNVPIGGDPVENAVCQECDGTSIVWEEYGTSDSDVSILGTHCEDCGDTVEPE